MIFGFGFLQSSGSSSTGTVTSVGLSLPAEFAISGSPVTTSGTLTGAWASQTQNLVFASPNGSTGVPIFRALVEADIPSLSSIYVPYTGASTDVDLNAKSLKNFFISQTADITAKFTFDVSALSTATIRTLTVPNRSFTLDNITNASTTNLTGYLKGNGTNVSVQAAPIPLSDGGTSANLTASNGGIFYSTASAGAILSGTATASKMLLSGASAAPTWSTSTIPSSAGATANKVLLSDGTNYVLSTPTFPNASATSGKVIISDGTNFIASTTIFPNSATTNRVVYATGTNTLGESANLQFTGTYASVGGAANTGSLAQAFQLFPTNTYYWQGYYNTGLAHGMTSIAPTNCAAFTSVFDTGVNGGGMQILALTGSTANIPALELYGISGAGTPTIAPFRFRAAKKSGTSITSLASTDPAYSFLNSATNLITILGSGNAGFGGVTSPSAQINTGIGTATAGTSPFKFTISGTTLLATPEAGVLEPNSTTSLFYTNSGLQRQEIPLIQQTRTTSGFNKTNTTLADITGLTATLVAGKTYRFEAKLYLTVSLTGGIKTAIGGTATATSFIGNIKTFDSGDYTIQLNQKITAIGGISGITSFTDSDAYVEIYGTITVNAAGTLTVQAAQNSASGTSTVLAGSTFKTTEMA